MDVLVRRIKAIGASRELVFAAIQLAPPAIYPVTENRTYAWHQQGLLLRTNEAERTLTRLFAGDCGRKPDVVVFSEYSLPPEAHEKIPFQELANTNKCIIIAGSYFDADEDSTYFRHNVCKIYLPFDEPLTICKCVPADEEKEFLLCSDDFPNIARLVWEIPDKDPVSINVFLCRDYLSPFRVQPNSQPEKQDATLERVSLLDWEREGINVVVMLNQDPTVFEAAAAFDIRRTHGKRKLVLLVNSASQDETLATALIGATANKDKSRSIAAKMPPQATGVLIVETMLSDVVARKEDPDTDRSFPIKHWDCHHLVASPTYHLERIRRKEDAVPERRGIFHPAFLAVMQKYIVIELFVARSTRKVRDAFSDERGIDFVTASYVRGVEDVIVRRYVESHTLADLSPAEIPSLSKPSSSLPYSRLTKDEFAEAFDTDLQAPHLRVLLDPRHIRKFRGMKIGEVSEQEWVKRCLKISETIRPTRDIAEILRIGTELQPQQEIPKKFGHVFCGIEDVVPVGREFDKQIRETYLFVATEGADGSSGLKRFGSFLDTHLMRDERVRDIYHFSMMSVNPPMPRHRFSFLLRLKCGAFDTDEIVASIQDWASESRVYVGTRSYDAWRSLRRSATDGMLASTMSREEKALQKALFAIDPEINFPPKEVQDSFANAIAKHTKFINEIQSDEWNHLATNLAAFLHTVCLYNCAYDPDKQKRYREEAANRWNALFKFLETASSRLLIDALGLPEKSNRKTVVKALSSKFPEYFKGGKHNADGFLTWFAELYEDLKGSTNPLVKEVNANLNSVSAFRNIAVHGGAADDLDISITVKGDQAKGQFAELDKKVAVMCSLIAHFAQEVAKPVRD